MFFVNNIYLTFIIRLKNRLKNPYKPYVLKDLIKLNLNAFG